MHIQIDTGSRLDQSGDTIFAFSNEIQRAIRLRQGVRDECLDRLSGRRLSKELRVFAACIYLLIKDYLGQLEDIVIDNEYPGHEGEVKRHLANIIHAHSSVHFQEARIKIASITKRSRAHKVAWETLRKKREVDATIAAKEILALLIKSKERTGGFAGSTVADHSYHLSTPHKRSFGASLWHPVLSI